MVAIGDLQPALRRTSTPMPSAECETILFRFVTQTTPVLGICAKSPCRETGVGRHAATRPHAPVCQHLDCRGCGIASTLASNAQRRMQEQPRHSTDLVHLIASSYA